MKLLVLTVVTAVVVWTANCSVEGDGWPEDQVFTTEPEVFPRGFDEGFPTPDPDIEHFQREFDNQLKDGSVQDDAELEVPMEFNVTDLETDKEGGLEFQTDVERNFLFGEEPGLESDRELRAMSVNISSGNSNLYTEMNTNKIMNDLIANLTIANAKMLDFMTTSITNLTSAIAEIKTEQKFIKGNMTNALSSQDTKLSTIRKHQGCPEGMFYFTPSDQCFLLLHDTGRSWYDSDKACQAKGLVLAQPYEPEALRKYIVLKYGDGNYVWIGARGTGGCFKFLRTNRCIGSSNPLWYSRSYSTSNCVMMMCQPGNWKSYGIRLLYSTSCSSRYWTLCEHITK